jgi:hypothetical protein
MPRSRPVARRVAGSPGSEPGRQRSGRRLAGDGGDEGPALEVVAHIVAAGGQAVADFDSVASNAMRARSSRARSKRSPGSTSWSTTPATPSGQADRGHDHRELRAPLAGSRDGNGQRESGRLAAHEAQVKAVSLTRRRPSDSGGARDARVLTPRGRFAASLDSPSVAWIAYEDCSVNG